MALSKIVRDSLNTGIDDNSDATAITIDSSENVGIGTATPDEYVHIKGASGAATDVQIQGGDDTNSVRLFMGGSSNRLNGRIVYDVANNAMALSTNGDERMRIDSSGNVGIGTSNPDVASDGTAARTFFAVQGTANRGVLNLGTSSSAGADIATINFNNGANSAASIVVDGVSGSTTNAHMYFYTSGGNRMYIKDTGHIHMGDSKQYDSSVLNIASSGLTIINAATNGHFRQCYQSGDQNMYWSSGSNQAYLSSGGTWTDASDIAYKKDITDATYGIDTVKALQPRFYYMKDEAIEDKSRHLGFIAQELEAVVPEVVSGDDGSKGVEYGHLTAVLTKALQEAVAKIETLEAKVAALEGN